MELIRNLLIRIAISLAVGLAVWLPIVFSIRREGRKFTEQLDGLNYELRQPKFVFWIGIVCAALFFIPIIIVPATGNETFTPFVAIGFFAFAILGTFLAVYALQWRITVRNNRLIVRMPFRAEREMKIEDVTTVKEKYNGIIAYLDNKRIFDVDKHVIGFDLLCAQLYEAGRLETTQKRNGFTIKQHKGNIVIGISGSLFFGSCFIWTVFRPDETVNSFVYIYFLGFAILSLYLLIHTLRWRLVVTDDTMSVRKMIGEEKSYSIKAITWVNIKKESIVIYIGKKKIAKVAVGCRNFPILSGRLNSEGITFVYRGRPIE